MLQLRLHDSEVAERIPNDYVNVETVRAEVGIRLPLEPKGLLTGMRICICR